MKTKILRSLVAASCLVLALFTCASAQPPHTASQQSASGQLEAAPSTLVDTADEEAVSEDPVSEPGVDGPQDEWLEPSPDFPGCQPTGCCCQNCRGGSNCPSCWYFESGVRILSRSAPRHRSLVFSGTDVYGGGRSDVFSTRSLEYDIAPGYTATLGRYLARTAGDYDEFAEISYWGLNRWQNTQSVDTNIGLQYVDGQTVTWFGNLFTPFPAGGADLPADNNGGIGGFNRFTKATFDVEHTVHNVEANLWLRPRARADRLVLQENGSWVHLCQPGCYWSHMVGFRAMRIDDKFGLFTLGFPTTDNVTGAVWGDYEVEARNTLLGLQVGGDLMFRRCRWSWGTRYRVAPLVNLAEQRTTVVSDATDDPLADLGNYNLFGSADRAVAAVAMELGVVGSYHVLPNLVLNAAYDIMWVSGVALAPEQVDFTLHPNPILNAPPRLNTGGTLFYQGLTFSAALTW